MAVLETFVTTALLVRIAVGAAFAADVTAVITAPAPAGMPIPVATLPTVGMFVGSVA